MTEVMRKVFRTIVVLAVAAVAMSACKKELQEFPASNGIKVDFVAQSLDTRTEFGAASGGSIPVLWQAGDKVKIIANTTEVGVLEVTPSSDFKTGTFSADLPTTFPYVVFALSPSSAFVSTAHNTSYNDYIQYMISANQTPVEGNIDPAAQVLLAKTEEISEAPATSLSVNFKHLSAYGKLTLNNIPGGKAIKSITLDFSADKVGVAGRFIYQEADDAYFINPSSMAYSITLKTTQTENVYFGIAPVDISGKTLTVSVEVDGGNYLKTLTVPSGKEFKSGIISAFTVNMADAVFEKEKVYTLVTDLSTLEEGDEIIIASAKVYDTPNIKGHSVLSTQYNTNNIQAICIEECFDGTSIVNPPVANVDVFTLEKSSISGTWLFKSAAKDAYVARKNGNKDKNYTAIYTAEQIAGDEALLKSSSWSLSVEDPETHAVLMKSNCPLTFNSGYGPNLRTNVTDDGKTYIFSCYGEKDGAPKQDPICLYKRVASNEPEPEKVLTVERVWGKFSTSSASWNEYYGGTPDTDRNVAMDDNYIYLAEATIEHTKKLWALNVADGSLYKALPTSTVKEEGTFYLSCPRVINFDGTPTLVVCNMTYDAWELPLTLYVYENGIEQEPTAVLLRAYRCGRLGDTFSVWSASATNSADGQGLSRGMLYFHPMQQADYKGVRIFKTTWTKGSLPTETDYDKCTQAQVRYSFENGNTCAGAFWTYPGNKDAGIWGGRNYEVKSVFGSVKSGAPNLWNASGDQTENTQTEEISSGWYVSVPCYQFFTFNNHRYIAYTRQVSDTDGRLIILEGEETAEWKDIITAHKVVYQAAIQENAENQDYYNESLKASGNAGMDLCIRVKSDGVYMVCVKQNVGLSLFKMSIK